MEGQLNQDDSILKVAVKTMKSESVHTHVHTHGTSSPSPWLLPYAPKEVEEQES